MVVDPGVVVEPLCGVELHNRGHGILHDEGLGAILDHFEGCLGIVASDHTPEEVGVDVVVEGAAGEVEVDDIVAADVLWKVDDGDIAWTERAEGIDKLTR